MLLATSAFALCAGGQAPQSIFLALPLNLGPALAITALLWLGAAGIGAPLRKALLPNATSPALTQAGLGMALMLIVYMLIGIVGLMNRWTAIALPAIGLVLLAIEIAKHQQTIERYKLAAQRWPWTLLMLAPGAALLLIASACPPGTLWSVEAFGYDVTSYHLQIPREWMASGSGMPLEHNVYSFFPGLMEYAYYAIGSIHGDMRPAIYSAQAFHASFALLAAWGAIAAARRYAHAAGAAAAGLSMLLLPWVIITGSSAYNELVTLGFAAVALHLALEPGGLCLKRGAAIGLLLGSAVLAKLTAGPMLALPIAAIACFPDLTTHAASTRPATKHRAMTLAVIAAAGCLTLSPYLVRNTVAVGNPVFPFTTSVFGNGHWDQTLTDRWQDSHQSDASDSSTLDALNRQWLGNAGFGALGGEATPRESQNIARFSSERGLPVFWFACLAAFALCLGHPRTWRTALVMLGVITWQLLFWRLGTHMQSRFLIHTLLPAGIILGVGAGRIREVAAELSNMLEPIAAMALLGPLLVVCLTTLWQQTPRMRSDDGQAIQQPLWMGIDALGDPDNPDDLNKPGTHPINLLPDDSLTLILADNSALLYIERPIRYASAFDQNLLGVLVRENDGDIQAINADLRELGVTHIWISWSEIARLSATYGFDDAITPKLLIALAESWWPGLDPRLQAPLFQLPPADAHSPANSAVE